MGANRPTNTIYVDKISHSSSQKSLSFKVSFFSIFIQN